MRVNECYGDNAIKNDANRVFVYRVPIYSYEHKWLLKSIRFCEFEESFSAKQNTI